MESSSTQPQDLSGERADLSFPENLRIEVISQGVDGELDQSSRNPDVSDDGRFVVFSSTASNLIDDDTNGVQDVFLYDRTTNTVRRIPAFGDSQPNSGAGQANVSADGRFVTFASFSTNFIEGDTNRAADIFVYDSLNNTTERVSVNNSGVAGNGSSFLPDITPDGRFVTFYSEANNLVEGDTNERGDVFVYDRDTDSIERVSVDDDGNQGNGRSSGDSSPPVISADGRYVAFKSQATNLVEGDTRSTPDAFLYDRQTDTIKRISLTDTGEELNGGVDGLSISADGRFITFSSFAGNVLAQDSSSRGDIYVYDRDTEAIERISDQSNGDRAGRASFNPKISADGRYVTFSSSATLVPGAGGLSADILRYDRDTDTLIQISTDSAGNSGDRSSSNPSISADGRVIAFESEAKNLLNGETEFPISGSNVFVYDQQGRIPPSVARVSTASPDGTYSEGDIIDVLVEYTSEVTVTGTPELLLETGTTDRAAAYVSGSGSDTLVFRYAVQQNDRARDLDYVDRNALRLNGGSVTSAIGDAANIVLPTPNRIGSSSGSENSLSGTQDITIVTTRTLNNIGRERVPVDISRNNNSNELSPSFSADGRYVAFYSDAGGSADSSGSSRYELVIYDRQNDTLEQTGSFQAPFSGAVSSSNMEISADGRFVVFEAVANSLTENNTRQQPEIFVYSRETQTIERVSLSSSGEEGDGRSTSPSISADGRFVAFISAADNFAGDVEGFNSSVFVRDRQTGTTERISTGQGLRPSISADGRFVTYASIDSNGIENDNNAQVDIFVYDRDTDTTERVSVGSSGEESNGYSIDPFLSADGRFVAFSSVADNLVEGDDNGISDIFLRDRETNTTERISIPVAPEGISQFFSGQGSFNPIISQDNRYVTFQSTSNGLVEGDVSTGTDAFVYDRTTGNTTRISGASYGNNSFATAFNPVPSGDGRFVAFQSANNNLTSGDDSGFDIFIYDRDTTTPLVTNVSSTNSDGLYGIGDTINVTVDFTEDVTVTGTPQILLNAGFGFAAADYSSGSGTDQLTFEYIVQQFDETEDLTTSNRNPFFGVDLEVGTIRNTTGNNANLNFPDANQLGSLGFNKDIALDGRAPFVAEVERPEVGSAFAVGEPVSFTIQFNESVAITGTPQLLLGLGNTERTATYVSGSGGDTLTFAYVVAAGDEELDFGAIAQNTLVLNNGTITDLAGNATEPTLPEPPIVFPPDPDAIFPVERTSLANDGSESNSDSFGPSLSGDGRFTAFWSRATNLVEGDTNETADVFVYDRDTQTTERVSIRSDGGEVFQASVNPSISDDGRYVAFESRARTLVPGETLLSNDVFLYDRDTDTIKGITVQGNGFDSSGLSSQADISADGRYVAFTSGESGLISNDTNNAGDILVYDVQTEVIERVSVGNDGAEGNSDSGGVSLSADGRYAVFTSSASNLIESDTNEITDIFIRDREASITERVSFNTDGSERTDGIIENATVSADGRFVAYSADAPGINPNSSGGRGAFLFDRDTDTTTRIDVDENGDPIASSTGGAVISADGRFVSFSASINNPRGDRPGQSSSIGALFVYDRQSGQLNNLSQDSNGVFANNTANTPDISADGRYISFTSRASNWIDDDTNGVNDIFVYDRGEDQDGGGNGGSPKVRDLLIDLTAVTQPTITASFEVLREAGFNNTISLYTVENEQGAVRDPLTGGILNPNEAGYQAAALANRAGPSITGENNQTLNYSAQLAGGRLFSTFIVADGTIEALLDADMSNDPAVFFGYVGANSDRTEHIRTLGNNTFGYEDITGGGDMDFNDITVKVSFA